MKIAILGAGLAGLSSGFTLIKDGHDIEIFETQNTIGGLAKSVIFEGCTFDIGPHRFHSKNKDLIKRINKIVSLDVKKRISHIYLKNKLVEYPLTSTSMLSLPFLTSLNIGLDYLKTKLNPFKIDDSFETWVKNRFGKKMYEIYFGPYTEKVWGLKPSLISQDWAIQRIGLFSLWDAVKNILFKTEDTPRTYVSKFYYPKEGGIGKIAKGLVENLESGGGKIHLNKTVGMGFLKNRKKYDFIISTIPITQLLKVDLKYRALILLDLILKEDIEIEDMWLYFPEKNFIFNRVSFPKKFNKNNIVDDKYTACVEIACNFNDKFWNAKKKVLEQLVIRDLEKTGLISKEQIESSNIIKEKFAYPVYDLNYKIKLERAKEIITKMKNVILLGRNGLFTYNNMDHSIEAGFKIKEFIKGFDIKIEKGEYFG